MTAPRGGARDGSGGKLRRPIRFAFLALVVLSLCACGFHLRGTGGQAVLPPALASVRIAGTGPLEYDPLAEAVREALARAGARITAAEDAPAIVLLGEQVATRVASVRGTTGKAAEYLLLYSATFRVDGPRPIAPQTVRLQRDYSFDPEQVLAKEQQEQELLASMRQEAAQQIVRRLARLLASGTR